MDYPKVGSIQVSKSGKTLVYVWPLEGGTSGDDFCGVSLLNSDISCCWAKDEFESENLFKKPLIKKFMQLRKQVKEEQQGGESE